MFHCNASDALAEATPEACQSLRAQGITHTVLVENHKGEWFLLHAESEVHALNLAIHWVDAMFARGASCREIRQFCLGPSFHHVWEQIND